ncbi:HU family DNA-binding protein [Rhodobacteraceae bacterium HSP-20]|uniref:HU family DNA-binding protein n=1 Tax=Paragemmobacter amnigenus TaxID=2852097 RepID=A0ABS6J465_9RHOB|nr:HU family DNA-binding protein [Rhodobacter amnigenus]MBU9698539.1 HU family DNA-binding protein [Rhodobacter amnigenus]MBV4389766.1 HU family DNA-binding protein [Rhodobacter amnigenus]
MASSSAKKSATKKSTAAKPRISAAKVTAPVTEAPADAAPASGESPRTAAKAPVIQLKKKELIARVVEALDGKKKGAVKDIVEATLATLGAALQKGETLNLPPFGRARVTKQTGEGAASQTTVRLRGAGAKNAPKGPKEALAEVGEDD